MRPNAQISSHFLNFLKKKRDLKTPFFSHQILVGDGVFKIYLNRQFIIYFGPRRRKLFLIKFRYKNYRPPKMSSEDSSSTFTSYFIFFEQYILFQISAIDFCFDLTRMPLEKLNCGTKKQVFVEFRESSFEIKPPNHR